MDTNCAEDSKVVRMLFGLALAALCTGIGAHTVLDRELARLGDSMNESDMVVENVDEIVDDLNYLDISMRAFGSAGDGRFSDDVVLSITGLEVHMESLLQLPVKKRQLKHCIGKLNHMVKRGAGFTRRFQPRSSSAGKGERNDIPRPSLFARMRQNPSRRTQG